MKHTIKTAALAMLGTLALAGTAHATITHSQAVGGAPTAGVYKQNFDSNTSGDLGNGLTLTLSGTGALTSGSVEGQYAAPFLSGGNGTGFGPGGTDQANGADATTYLTSGTGTETIVLDFATDQKYFGLLWGSMDDHNTISFYNDGILIVSFTGVDISINPTGDQGIGGTHYVNFFTNDTPFDSVRFSSTQNSFEFDNVAYGERVPAPEPLTLALFGAGLAGLGLARRRQNRKA